ncbi:LacI family DNA-binding transcriptional regulator [Ancylobacter aquaticus]|nr:LacI family DNA-binding transcriptional regulator [Ancylobacter aquaticus]
MIDVARAAKVGLTTVSRVLNEPKSVSEETRQRVMRAIAEIGYVPNLVAGSLASRRTNVVAAMVPTIGNPVFSETIESMSDEFREEGFHLLLGRTGEDESETESLISTFLARRPDALFIHGSKMPAAAHAMLQRAAIPVVESGDLSRAEGAVDMVVAYSNFAAAKAMTSHLLSRGHRKIAFVGRETRLNDRAQERQRGYSAALKEARIPVRSELILDLMLGYQEGAQALLHLRAVEPDLDAIFFAGDVWAAGALYECQRQGWRVPTDIAIAGFDDHIVAAQTVPPLTTVRVRRGEIGRRAAQLLLSRLRGDEVVEKIINVGFEIIERESA